MGKKPRFKVEGRTVSYVWSLKLLVIVRVIFKKKSTQCRKRKRRKTKGLRTLKVRGRMRV